MFIVHKPLTLEFCSFLSLIIDTLQKYMYFSVINIKSHADNNRERMSQKLNVNCQQWREKWKMEK